MHHNITLTVVVLNIGFTLLFYCKIPGSKNSTIPEYVKYKQQYIRLQHQFDMYFPVLSHHDETSASITSFCKCAGLNAFWLRLFSVNIWTYGCAFNKGADWQTNRLSLRFTNKNATLLSTILRKSRFPSGHDNTVNITW